MYRQYYHFNSRGKTAAMYLVENGREEELKVLCELHQLHPNLN